MIIAPLCYTGFFLNIEEDLPNYDEANNVCFTLSYNGA